MIVQLSNTSLKARIPLAHVIEFFDSSDPVVEFHSAARASRRHPYTKQDYEFALDRVLAVSDQATITATRTPFFVQRQTGAAAQ